MIEASRKQVTIAKRFIILAGCCHGRVLPRLRQIYKSVMSIESPCHKWHQASTLTMRWHFRREHHAKTSMSHGIAHFGLLSGSRREYPARVNVTMLDYILVH